MARVVFVGGVHGVGKSSMCSDAAAVLGATHLTASTLIREAKHEAVSSGSKRAQDVPGNQELLVGRFKQVEAGLTGVILLDGHFTVLDADGAPVRLPADLFRSLGIESLVCVRGDPASISYRVGRRDGSGASSEEVSRHQQIELEQARLVSEANDIPLHFVEAFDTDALISAINAKTSLPP